MARINYTKGERVGYCIFLEDAQDVGWRRKAKFLCECGNEFTADIQSVKTGHAKSCGCKRIAEVKKTSTKHGLSHLPEFKIWVDIRRRCYQPQNKSYANYGGRGIGMSEEWRNSFENFIRDVGRRPSAVHTIDRIDNNKGYEPGNCKWSTREDQGRNKRNNILINWKGEIVCRAELCKRYGARPENVDSRLKNGWDLETALITPFKKYKTK